MCIYFHSHSKHGGPVEIEKGAQKSGVLLEKVKAR